MLAVVVPSAFSVLFLAFSILTAVLQSRITAKDSNCGYASASICLAIVGIMFGVMASSAAHDLVTRG